MNKKTNTKNAIPIDWILEWDIKNNGPTYQKAGMVVKFIRGEGVDLSLVPKLLEDWEAYNEKGNR